MEAHSIEPARHRGGDPAGGWSPDSWRDRCAAQQPTYGEAGALAATIARLRERPPLVDARKVDHLTRLLAEAATGARFLIQAGDCAEELRRSTTERIGATAGLIDEMAAILSRGLRLPVVRVGRIAGQYAKPRSSATERRGAAILPSYRGDLVNGADSSISAAAPARGSSPATRGSTWSTSGRSSAG